MEMLWIAWLALAVLFILPDLIYSQRAWLWVSLGFILGGILGYVDTVAQIGAWIQFVGIGVGIVLAIIYRISIRRNLERLHVTNMEQLIGAKLVVISKATKTSTARAKFGDVDFAVVPSRKQADFAVGNVVIALKIKGVTLICKRSVSDKVLEKANNAKARRAEIKSVKDKRKAENKAQAEIDKQRRAETKGEAAVLALAEKNAKKAEAKDKKAQKAQAKAEKKTETNSNKQAKKAEKAAEKKAHNEQKANSKAEAKALKKEAKQISNNKKKEKLAEKKANYAEKKADKKVAAEEKTAERRAHNAELRAEREAQHQAKMEEIAQKRELKRLENEKKINEQKRQNELADAKVSADGLVIETQEENTKSGGLNQVASKKVVLIAFGALLVFVIVMLLIFVL